MRTLRPTLLPTLLLALFCPAPTPRAQSADEFAEPRQYVNGMSWRILAAAEHARGDDYWVIARIEFDPRYRDRELTLLPGCLVLQLTAPDGKVRTHVLARSGLPKVAQMYVTDDTDVSLNLRDAFGELEPGLWFARWILREDRYRVQGHATSPEIVAEYTFKIFTVTREAAARAAEPTEDVVLHVPPLDPKTPNDAIATLTNRTDRPIEFGASPESVPLGPPAWREPLPVQVLVERFVPPAPWRNHGGIAFCGTGLLAYRLDPGKSVRVTFHGLRGAQLTRVRLPYRLAGDPTFTPYDATSNVIEAPPR